MTQSNPTACAIDYPPGLLDVLADKRNVRYRPSPLGLLDARRAICREYLRQGVRVDPGNVVLTSSTSEAYSFALRLLANPGDRVLFPSPGYPLLDHLAQLNDVAVDRYALRYDGSWYADLASLEKALRKDTRAVVVVHPNNPTGSYLKKEEWNKLSRICAQHKLAVISDEVFQDYPHGSDKKRACTLAGTSDVLVFSLNGISKMLGLPQMKVAWICVGGPPSLRKQALQKLEMIADTVLSVNIPAQQALPHWLTFKKRLQGRILRRVLANRHFLEARQWHKHGGEVLPVEGGWYAVLRVPSTKTEEEWVLELLRDKQVLVHPGYFFDFERHAHLILSLLPEPRTFVHAVRGILETVAKGCKSSLPVLRNLGFRKLAGSAL